MSLYSFLSLCLSSPVSLSLSVSVCLSLCLSLSLSVSQSLWLSLPQVTATFQTMNCDPTDPTYPILVNPYSTAMMGQTLSQPLLTVGLGDLTSSWLPYQDLRGLDAAASAYETDVSGDDVEIMEKFHLLHIDGAK